jgi:hypothetical protein
MNTCHCHKEINRDGSSQLNRYLKALDPSYVPIDGRRIEDLLVYARSYASQIRFYDLGEKENSRGSWEEFFSRDMAVIIASLSVFDLEGIRKNYDQSRKKIEENPNADNFAALFAPILGVVTQLDHWYSVAIAENPLHNDLEVSINSNLRGHMKKVVAYEKGFNELNSIDSLQLDYSEIKNEDIWGIKDTIEPDSSIYQGSDLNEKIRHASLFIDDIFHVFYACLSHLINKSEDYMHFALEKYPGHQPHMALFIAFLKLFHLAQEQMNGLTEKILDFYYRDVLHLEEKSSIPDRVHLIFELAKDVAEYHLPPGTMLNAGKDPSGKEQVYKTKTDLVINQSKVKELKTIFIEKEPLPKKPSNVIRTIFARPVANSLDGFGEKFTDTFSKWHTFGQGSPKEVSPKNICQEIEFKKNLSIRKDQTKIGFAIASPQLLLQGGNRLIQIKLERPNSKKIGFKAADDRISKNYSEIWLTGEKGWVKIDSLMDNDLKDDLVEMMRDSKGIFSMNVPNDKSSYCVGFKSIFIFLPIAEQSIIAFNPKLHSGCDFKTTHPVMRVMINPEINLKEEDFHGFKADDLSIRVKVGSIFPPANAGTTVKLQDKESTVPEVNHLDGLKTLVLQNDLGLIPPNGAFDPFTPYPFPGKSLYIGSHEVFNKPVNQLAINIKKTNPQDSNEKYNVCVLQNRCWTELSPDGELDFDISNLKSDILYLKSNEEEGENEDKKDIEHLDLDRMPITPVTRWQSLSEKGFIRLNFTLPLLKNTKKAILTAQNLVSSEIKESFLIAQNIAPFLEIKELSVSYDSNLSKLENGTDQFFHVYPFGVVETYLELENQEGNGSNNGGFIENEFSMLKEKNNLLVNAHNILLPQFTYLDPDKHLPIEPGDNGAGPSLHPKGKRVAKTIGLRDNLKKRRVIRAIGVREGTEDHNNQYSGEIQEEGMLFIGLEGAKPPQSVSLLFQFAEGSAEDEEKDPPPIHWSYLSNNEWIPLNKENLVSDGTLGFQTTGVVKIDVPSDATNHNTIISDGLHWLCASMTENSNRIPQLVNVVAQVVLAQFEDQNNDQIHYEEPLPGQTIKSLSLKVAEIIGVDQPFASFDGKPKEIGKKFYTRASERLRHKDRAINTWDYERLILNRFPGIFKVKCIPHTDPNCLCRHSGSANGNNKTYCCGPQIAPGHVLVIPISNLKNRIAINPLQPKTSRRVLLEIEDYLKKRTSPFVKVHARNPMYEQILVSFKVKFHSGIDKGYYLKKLNDEIVHFLTPWAFDEKVEVKFDQKIYASAIINFIEERRYVDFITDFIMDICLDRCCYPFSENEKENVKSVHDDICGCDEMEFFLQVEDKMNGVTVAKPSTPRSILVSFPRHNILPYVEPEPTLPCSDIEEKT